MACLSALCAVVPAACAAGDTETEQVAAQIDAPPQASAAAYARKALETDLGFNFRGWVSGPSRRTARRARRR